FQGLRQLTTVVYWSGGEAGRKTVFRLLEQALAREPGDYRLARSLANRYARLRPPKWSEAAHYDSIALAIRPRNVYAHVNLAKLYRTLGKSDEATALIRRAIHLKPLDARAHFVLGSALSVMEHQLLDDAIAHYREAVRLKPDWADAHVYLGAALARKGHKEG